MTTRYRCINASTHEVKRPVEGGGVESVWQHSRTLEVVDSNPIEHVNIGGAMAAEIEPGKTYTLVEVSE